MTTCTPTNQATSPTAAAEVRTSLHEIQVGLLTGGQDPHYAVGLAMSLVQNNVSLDVIGSDEVDRPEFHSTPKVRFLNLRGDQRLGVGLGTKVLRVSRYYARLLGYAATAKPKLLHILWNNKFELFDRTLLLLYYKLLGKKIVLTAHNVNIRRRDAADSRLNRLTLRIQYRTADHTFVHTEKMKAELVEEFAVLPRAVSVIPYGINNAVPDTALSPAQAKRQLGITENEKTILFFGAIAPYKGLDLLLTAFQRMVAADGDYRLLIAGKPKGGCGEYVRAIEQTIREGIPSGRVTEKIAYIPDQEMELYFKAADVVAMPYREIFQSGVLFLAQSFGLPAIITDVGSFRDEIIEGTTGFLCQPDHPVALAETIQKYFASPLYRDLSRSRKAIREHAQAQHSWEVVGRMTRKVYAELLGQLA